MNLYIVWCRFPTCLYSAYSNLDNWCCLVYIKINMESLFRTDPLQLDSMLKDREIIGLVDPDETENVLRGLQDVIDKDIDPDDVNNNFIQTDVVNNRIITTDDFNDSLTQPDETNQTCNVLDNSNIGTDVAQLNGRGCRLHDSTIECNNLLDYKYSTNLSGIGAFAIEQYVMREPPEYNNVASPGSSSGSNSAFSLESGPGSSSGSNSVYIPGSRSESISVSNCGSKCSSQYESFPGYSAFPIEHHKSYENISQSTNNVPCTINKSSDTLVADMSSSTTEPSDQSGVPDTFRSVNVTSVRSGVRRSARNKKYNLRTSSIINRVETEQRRNTPKKPKPKNKPAPLSKYRRKTANTRERSRMQEVNDAFEDLQKVVPDLPSGKGKPTKITILQLAMNYISALREMLGYEHPMDLNCRPNPNGHGLYKPR